MSKVKEEYHFYLANDVTIKPQHVQQVPRGSRVWYEFIEDVVRYCCHRMELEELEITVKLEEKSNCCGESWQKTARSYGMRICTNQNLRDVVATVCHEMVHVQQWVEDEWQGDGEKEAEARQYDLADDYWMEWDALK
tara:strand:- start:8 stop:418 length:411 start_codon:yes stop_codon:yes gene_type:complete